MNNGSKKPDWINGLERQDRPPIDKIWRPEDGPLEGSLVWQGEVADQQGEEYHQFVLREAATDANVGVSEKAALRPLRTKPAGTLVYIAPEGKTELGDGRTMWRLALYCAPRRRGGTSTPPITSQTPF